MKPFLLITGMHRSGTSFLARSLNLRGVYLGKPDSLISDQWRPAKDNVKGHWENQEFLNINEKILYTNNSSWHNPPENIVINKEIGDELTKSIQELTDHPSLAVGFKDPRILLYLDSIVKYLPKDFVIISIFRNPLKVAESLKKRDQFSYEKSSNLWKIYNQKLLEHLEKHGGFLLNFDWPKEKILSELDLISNKLDLSTNDISEWYSEELLNSDKSYDSNYSLPDDVKFVYSKLKERSESNHNVKTKPIVHRSTIDLKFIIQGLISDLQTQGNYFKKLNEQNLESKKREAIQNLENLQNALSSKDAQLEDLQRTMFSYRKELEEIKNSVMFRNLRKIAETIDKAFPTSTKRGKAIRMGRSAISIAKEDGLLVLGQALKNKIKEQSFRTEKYGTTHLIKNYNTTANSPATNLASSIIYNYGTLEPDHRLRKFLEVGSANILKLSRFPKISIIIPTYNQVEFLRKNLESIERKSTYKNYEIIIVTNNLDEKSEMRKFLKSIKRQVLIFEDEYSFSAVNNFAASKATGEFYIFLNDDVEIVSSNWLEALLHLAMDDMVGAVGAKLVSSDGALQEAGCIVWQNGNAWNYGKNQNPDDPNFNFVRSVDYCSASCLMVKKELFDKVGGFDKSYHPAYCEDTDMCFTIQKLGYRVLYQPLACVVHHEGKTQGTDTNTGIKAYQVTNLKKFKEKWKHTLESRKIDSPENAFWERNRKSGIRILYIDHYVPEYDKDSGSSDAYYVVSMLSYLDNQVTFWPDNLYKNEPYVTELQQKGIEVVYGPYDFESFVKERGWEFGICIMARAHISPKYIDLVKKYAPHCKIIYETVDLHFVRHAREAELKKNAILERESEKIKETELQLVSKSDFTIVKSREEAEILLKENQSLRIAIIPPLQIPSNNSTKYDERKDLLFLGGFQHPPNVDAVEFLATEIFPLIKKKIQNVKLYIIGSNAPQHVKEICSKINGVHFLGYVPDIEPYLQSCRIMLAPLRYGAGVKGKITRSMARGMPVVTTSIGAEGISGPDENILMIGDSIDEFVRKAVLLYQDEKLWTQLSLDGKRKIEIYFSPEAVRQTLLQLINECVGHHS